MTQSAVTGAFVTSGDGGHGTMLAGEDENPRTSPHELILTSRKRGPR